MQAPLPAERALIPRGALRVCIAGAFGDPLGQALGQDAGERGLEGLARVLGPGAAHRLKGIDARRHVDLDRLAGPPVAADLQDRRPAQAAVGEQRAFRKLRPIA